MSNSRRVILNQSTKYDMEKSSIANGSKNSERLYEINYHSSFKDIFANFTHSRDQGSLHMLVLQSRDCIFRFFDLLFQYNA